MLFDISLSSVGQPSVVTVPEVTVRSVAPISAVFALAVFRVKRTVNSPKEAGVSYHYPWTSLSFPPEHAALSLNVVLVILLGACQSVETITTFLRRHVGLVGRTKSRVSSHVSHCSTS